MVPSTNRLGDSRTRGEPETGRHEWRTNSIFGSYRSTGGRSFDGVALRVPVENGSLSDLTCQLSIPVTADEVNEVFLAASRERLDGILRYTTKPVVSRDLIGDPASCVFDASLTQAHGTLVKVLGWYDNEWGYTSRLVDLSLLFAEQA